MKRLLVGLLLAPTAAIALFEAGKAGLPVGARHLPLTLGFAGYALVHFLLLRPKRAYVFGHELTHALAAVLSGARVRRFVVGRDSGHVELSHTNVFIALAPYSLPLYAALVLAAHRLAEVWVPAETLRPLFLAALGFTLAFHLVQTFEALTATRQRDLDQAGGLVFSLACVAMANALVLTLLFKLLSPDSVSLSRWAATVGAASAEFWIRAASLARAGGAAAYERARG